MHADFSSEHSPYPYEELNSCEHLFLDEISEPKSNCLKLILREGRSSKVSVPIKVAGTDLGEGFPVVIDDNCATFVVEWRNYVLYQVLNESFGKPTHESEVYEGNLARKYSVSRLLQFVADTTHATNEYPGKLLHCEIICADHVINVICVEAPLCFKSGPTSKLQ